LNKKVDGKKIDRRTFLKGAAAGIGAIGIAGLSAAEAKTINLQQVTKWDYKADVVIVGYGAAGGNAAIAAHDAGAKVIILEKMPMAGGNSAVCYGGMVIPDSVPGAIEYYGRLSFGTVDEDTLKGFAEAMVEVPDLLKKLGAHINIRKRSPAFPSLLHSDIPAFRFAPTGKAGFQFLSELVEKRGIKVMLNTAAKNLIQIPETGQMVGVKAENEGKEIYILAQRGIVLSCGGYENNPEMFGYYNYPGLKDFIFPYGNPGNTGDGLKMASAAGAYLWHTASLQWASYCAKAPSKQFGVAVGAGISRKFRAGNFIFVNKNGNRFVKETKSIYHYKGPLEVLTFDHDRAEYPNVPAYLVFDETYRKSGPIPYTSKDIGPVGYELVHNIYSWSDDNLAEIERGWIIKTDTIADLAEKINVSHKNLEETIARFNNYCASGKDIEFDRSEGSMAAIKKPPYYALELGLVLVNTQGGPKHNRYGQVLDPDNKPIPRLYAAGELGSFFGFLYQWGSNYPEAWAFGRIAGRQAASEKPFKG
jgi:succinate dehydrogenase/fumarate reductase flavoprotein subunit